MNAAAGLVEVRVPDMGNFKDVAIIDVLVKPGEKIEPEAPLVTLETEKATMDVPSTVGGVVEKIHVSKGGTVSTGDLVVTVRSEGAAGAGAGGGAGGGQGAGAAGGSGQASTGAQASGGTQAGSGAQAPVIGGQGSLGAGSSGGQGAGQAGGAGGAAGAAGQGGAGGAGAGGQAPAGGQSAGSQSGGNGAGGAAGQASGGAVSGAASGGQGGSGGGSAAGAASVGAGVGAGRSGGPAAGAAGGGAGSGGAAGSSGGGVGSGGAAGTSGGGAGSTGAAGANGAGGASAAAGQGGSAGRLDLPPINEPGFSQAHAGPSVRRFARELGVDLTRVKGNGFKGRVTHDDVKSFVKNFIAAGTANKAPAASAPAATPAAAKTAAPASAPGLPTIPAIDFSLFGPVETKPLSRIQKISGPRLHASWVNIPHVTQFDDADITELEETRTKLKDKAQQAGIKLTPLAFIVRACVRALLEFPLFNSSLDPKGANLVLKKYIHVGFAADTPNGLVVPVIQDAKSKDIYEIARSLGELSDKARAGKLAASEMQGGSFTISSLGGIGGTAFTPIINAPEVAILGVSRSSIKPVFQNGTFVPRLILPLSLSYDHRVIDGASAARFTTFLAKILADPRSLTEAVP